MKKTTLISTLAMVVIVALALTTATFAWYQSNSAVTATSQASAATAGSADLSIKDTSDGVTGATYGTTAALTLTELQPSAVNSATALAIGTATTITNHWQDIQNKAGGGKEFKTGAAKTTNANNTKKVTLKNNSTETDRQVPVTLSVAVSNDTSTDTALTNGLRVGVILDGKVVAIIGATEYTYTDTFDGKVPNSTTDANKLTRQACSANFGAAVDLCDIVGQGETEVTLVFWLDGEEVDQDDATKTIDISLTFTGGAAVDVTP